MIFSINGNLVLTPTQAQLDAIDPSNSNNFGVFETLRTYGKEIFQWDAHLKRLQHSASLIPFQLPATLEQIRVWTQEALNAYKEKLPARLKIAATKKDIFIKIDSFTIDPAIYQGVSATCVEVERHQPQAKAYPYTVSYFAHEKAEKEGFYEALLVDSHGYVREGAYSNLFWVKNGQIFTEKDHALLGITQAAVCSWEVVKNRHITSQELLEMNEVFLTKTTTGAVPITSIDGKIIGNGSPGPVTHRILEKFKSMA